MLMSMSMCMQQTACASLCMSLQKQSFPQKDAVLNRSLNHDVAADSIAGRDSHNCGTLASVASSQKKDYPNTVWPFLYRERISTERERERK